MATKTARVLTASMYLGSRPFSMRLDFKKICIYVYKFIWTHSPEMYYDLSLRVYYVMLLQGTEVSDSLE